MTRDCNSGVFRNLPSGVIRKRVERGGKFFIPNNKANLVKALIKFRPKKSPHKRAKGEMKLERKKAAIKRPFMVDFLAGVENPR